MKRYRIEGCYDEKHDISAMEVEDVNGEFVLYDDVKALQKQVEELNKYTKHHDNCPASFSGITKCSCGLEQIDEVVGDGSPCKVCGTKNTWKQTDGKDYCYDCQEAR